MAFIDVEAPDGQFIEFEISGETPTEGEMRSIQNVMKNLDRYSVKQSDVEDEFDTTSGIPNAKLRAILSAAENKAEEENILNVAGFSVEDYTRDILIF